MNYEVAAYVLSGLILLSALLLYGVVWMWGKDKAALDEALERLGDDHLLQD